MFKYGAKTCVAGMSAHANGLQRETGHIREFAAQAIHDDPGGIEHRHVNRPRDAENEADVFIPQAEHLGAVQRYDGVATTANGLGKELACPRGEQIPAVGAEDVGDVAQMTALRRGEAFARGFDSDGGDDCGHKDDAGHKRETGL